MQIMIIDHFRKIRRIRSNRKRRRINEAETTREEEGGGEEEEEEEGFHWKLCYDYIIMSFSLSKNNFGYF